MKTVGGTKEQVRKKVEIDVELMVNTHNKIARGINVDQEVVSNLLLGGVINILQQHDAIEEMNERITSVEQVTLTDKLRIELLETWVQKQAEELKDIGEKLAGIESSNHLLEKFEGKVQAIEISIESLKVQNGEAKEGLNHDAGQKVKVISLDCEHCDVKFAKAIDLEKHMEEHGLERMHTCDVCGKTFHLNWRLDKHSQTHSQDSRLVHCHYFNNDKDCPFLHVGCMFKHEKAGLCLLKNCTRYLCQFEHRGITEEQDILDVDEEESEEEEEYIKLN